MTPRFKPPIIPAAFFGIVLGLAGLGNAWRAGHEVWLLPALIGEALMALATMVWALLLVLFILRCALAREASLSEAHHPVQCCFIGLVGVATMLIALAALPYSRLSAEILFGVGAAFTLGFALWRTGLLWRGNRDHTATTPVRYLPTVAGGFVTAGGAPPPCFFHPGPRWLGGPLFFLVAHPSVALASPFYPAATSLSVWSPLVI